jgi:hypothetical protein
MYIIKIRGKKKEETMSSQTPSTSADNTAAANDTVFWQNMEEVQKMQAAEVAQDQAEEEREAAISGQILANFEEEMQNLTDPNGGAQNLTPINLAANPTQAVSSSNSASKMTNRINSI